MNDLIPVHLSAPIIFCEVNDRIKPRRNGVGLNGWLVRKYPEYDMTEIEFEVWQNGAMEAGGTTNDAKDSGYLRTNHSFKPTPFRRGLIQALSVTPQPSHTPAPSG